MVEQDLLYAYQGLKDTTAGEESVEDHLPTSIQGASNLHSVQSGDKIRLKKKCLDRATANATIIVPPL